MALAEAVKVSALPVVCSTVFRVSAFRVQGFEFSYWGAKFRVQSLEFSTEGVRISRTRAQTGTHTPTHPDTHTHTHTRKDGDRDVQTRSRQAELYDKQLGCLSGADQTLLVVVGHMAFCMC